MTYSEFIKKLTSYAEEKFANFQRKLIFTKRKILGVRTPTLRKLAKEWKDGLEELFSFPDEYYETVFIKLTVVSALPYEEFLRYVERCVALMDNWALCDSFKASCIKRHKEEFLPVLERIFSHGGEYLSVTFWSFFSPNTSKNNTYPLSNRIFFARIRSVITYIWRSHG